MGIREDLLAAISEHEHYYGKFNLVDHLCEPANINIASFTELTGSLKLAICLKLQSGSGAKEGGE